jgi:hypothetical protein
MKHDADRRFGIKPVRSQADDEVPNGQFAIDNRRFGRETPDFDRHGTHSF